jgi:hypothetical protein
MIAGDYAHFDKSMPALLILLAFWVQISILEKSGNYSYADITACWGVAYDVAFPTVDYNGDLIQFCGSNPSGQIQTVEINGLVNSLYCRYAYAILHKEHQIKNNNPGQSWKQILSTFDEHVVLAIYGDDNVHNVHPDASFYNHTSIQRVLGDVGITYTMADKEAESIPYINIDDVSFLKRTWRYDEDVGAFLAPLETESITKMLSINVASKSISPNEQAIAVIESAVREYFFHGKDEFMQKTALLKDVVLELDLAPYVRESTFPSYNQLVADFWTNSKGMSIADGKVIRKDDL